MQHPLTRIFFTLIFYFLIISSLKAQTQSRFLEKIGIESGLSSNYPNSIIQDSKGFIWIGTNNGLNRYDGYQYKVFKYDANNTNTISDNLINDLLEDSNGNIWIGTSGGGLNLYNTTTGVITRFKHKRNDATSISSDVVLRIYEDSKLRLWVGTKNGLNLLDRSTMTFQSWLQPNKCQKCKYSIKGIVEDPKGNLWIGDEFYGLYYFTPSSGKFTKPHLKYAGEHKLPSDFIHDLDFSKGTLWVATDNGVALLNTKTEAYEEIALDNINDRDFIQDVYIWSIYNDNNGGIWLCTNGNGLIHYKLGTNKISVYESGGNSNYKIGNNLVQDVLVDKSKNIWIATRGNGLNKFDLKKMIFRHWENDNENSNSLVNNDVRAMLQDVDGTIWIGTSNGLSKFNPTSNLYKNYIKDFNYKADAKKPKIRAIYRSKSNDLWIGTQGGGLYKYNQKQDQFMLAKDFVNSPLATKIRHIESIYEPVDGILWLGTIGTGFLAYNTITSEFKTINPKNNNDTLLNLYVNCVLKASESEIWVGSNRGLILLNRNTLKFKLWEYKEGCDNCIIGNKIRSLFRNNDNKIWIGTRSGLAIFDPKSEKFEKYGINDGLPSEVIYGILQGVDGNIWLTTPNGLSRINPLNMQFKNITIPGNNILDMGGHAQGLDGILLVGGTTGFTIFNPNDIKTNTSIPEVVFTDIKIDNQSVVFDKNISELNTIDLRYDQNNLTFEFSALEFTNTQINKYQYNLEGFNDEWIEYGNKHDLTFTNLDPEKYVLKIKGSNNEGLWNEQGTALTINIKPPWWGTLWFRTFSILVIIGSVYMVYYLRVKGLKRVEAMLKKEVYEQTKELVKKNKKLEVLHREKDEFTSMLAHDLKNPLITILGYSSEHSSNIDLQSINKSGKRMLHLIENMLEVQKFENSKTQLDLKKNYLKSLAQEATEQVEILANEKRIQIHNSISTAYSVNADKHIIERVFVNLLSNAIKFSPTDSKIEISGNVSNDNPEELIVCIKDYGAGIPKQMQESIFTKFYQAEARDSGGARSTGLGLSFCKMAIEAHGGAIWVTSEINKGSAFFFNLIKLENKVLVKNIKKTETKKYESPLYALKFDKKDLIIFNPFIEKINNLTIHETGEWFYFFDNLEETENIKRWKQMMMEAVTSFDENAFFYLKQLITKQ